MEGSRKFLVEKINEGVVKLGDPRKFLGDKINEGVIKLGDPKVQESMGDFLQKTLHQVLHIFDNTWAFLVDKFDQILPPETRSQTLHHWAHIGLTVVLPIALILLFLYCCCGCICRCFCSFCRTLGRGTAKMMKAPGRPGHFMPRASFEVNPRGYFLDLRANKPLVF